MARSIQGFGTKYVGERDFAADGSYVTTEFVTALFIPLVPIRSFRVIETGGDSFALGRAFSAKTSYLAKRQPLCWRQVASIYGTLGLCIASFALFLRALGSRQDAGPMHSLYSHDVICGVLLFLSPTWPLFAGMILRMRAKTRAGLTHARVRIKRWAIAALLLLALMIYGFHQGEKEEAHPGSMSHPLIWSGPCPASIRDAETQGSMRLDHCFQHSKLNRQVCEFEDADHYVYVACDPSITNAPR